MADEILAKALRALGRKDRTEAEMRQWLEAREIEPEEVERIIGFLIENLALDDRRFAQLFTEDKRELSGWGAERIRQDLIRRGIDRELAETATAVSSDEEIERAMVLLAEREVDLRSDRGRGKALGLLSRRGYSKDDAYSAVRRAAR